LKETIAPAMDRLTRDDIKDQLPAIVEQTYEVEFDSRTERIYRSIAKDLLVAIRSFPKFSKFDVLDHYAGVSDGGLQGIVAPRLMALRMLCDHPQLLEISADNFDDPDTKAGSAYASTLRDSGALKSIKGSSKLDVTLEIISNILEESPLNKVVLFSFFKPMLSIIGQNLNCSYELFTGDMSLEEREEAKQRFIQKKTCRVLLSSDAGGVGVDLPVANYLINYDLPWSGGKFEQRQGRIVRISTEWPEVTLISIVVKDTIEERQLEMLAEKAAVSAAWLGGTGVSRKGEWSPTLGTLADFLEDRL
jgi:SNF2 family DNA or RNA helicase